VCVCVCVCVCMCVCVRARARACAACVRAHTHPFSLKRGGAHAGADAEPASNRSPARGGGNAPPVYTVASPMTSLRAGEPAACDGVRVVVVCVSRVAVGVGVF
jgi:hypothetical protein